MSKLLSALTILAAAAALTACGDMGPKAIDDGPNAVSGANVSADGPIHSPGGWRETVFFYIDDQAPESVVEAAIAAASSWNAGAAKEIMSYMGRMDAKEQANLYSTLSDHITVIYYDTDWRQHTGKSDGVLATTVWENETSNNDYIDRADVILNAQSFYYQDATQEAEDPDRIYDVVDTESVILHEFGHLLGLDHVTDSDDAYSIMHAKTFVGLDIYSRDLSQGDIERIQKIYNPETK